MSPFAKLSIAILTLALLPTADVCAVDATTAGSRTDHAIDIGTSPLEWSRRMADSQMAREGENLFYHGDSTRNAWNYTSGLFASALLRLNDETKDQKYADFAEKIVGSFVQPDGDIATYKYELYSVDNIPPARALLTLWERGAPEKIQKSGAACPRATGGSSAHPFRRILAQAAVPPSDVAGRPLHG